MWSFLPVVENKKRRGGFHIRPQTACRLTGAYGIRPYGDFERSAATRSTKFIIYYLLSIIYFKKE